MAAVKPKRARRQLPPRAEQLARLQGEEEFDVLIIGGGATGAGCALDATTRGLKTALVEYDDFASGTSSRSTKLIHGGVRYLQKAILGVFTSCFLLSSGISEITKYSVPIGIYLSREYLNSYWDISVGRGAVQHGQGGAPRTGCYAPIGASSHSPPAHYVASLQVSGESVFKLFNCESQS